MKLYHVKLRGLSGYTAGTVHGEAYALADNPDAAVKLVQQQLINQDIGFRDDREMESVTLLADEDTYPACKYRIYIADRKKETT